LSMRHEWCCLLAILSKIQGKACCDGERMAITIAKMPRFRPVRFLGVLTQITFAAAFRGVPCF
jgi:hypothetical protein